MPPSLRPRLLVVDDEQSADNWGQTLGDVEVGWAPTIAQARDRALDPFDFVFLELSLPDGDGGDLVRDLLNRPDAPGIAVITRKLTAKRSMQLQRAGAHLVLEKPVDRGTALEALVFLSERRSLNNEVLSFARHYNLSSREAQTLLCLAEGLTNAESAERMECQRSTINTYYKRLAEKLEVPNTSEVIPLLFRHRYRPPPPSEVLRAAERISSTHPKSSGVRWTRADDDDESQSG